MNLIYASENTIIELSKMLGIKENEFREMNKEGISALLLAFIDGVIWQSVLFNTDKKFNLRAKQAIQSFMNGIKK